MFARIVRKVLEMAFGNPVNNLVIPSGAGAGQPRIVLGADLPAPLDSYLVYGLYHYKAAIIMYDSNASNTNYSYMALYESNTGIAFDLGAVNNGVMVETNPGGGTGTPASLNYHIYDIGGGIKHAELAFQANLIDAQFAAWQPIRALGPGTQDTPDGWNSPGFGAGFAGALKYRMVASPPECVQLIAQFTLSGAKGNGTTIANIGAGWRPATAQDLPGACNNVVAGGESPHLNIATNGDVKIYGFTAATFGSASGTYSLTY